MNFNEISIEELRQQFSYDPNTGIVMKIGQGTKNPLGYLCSRGYVRMKFRNINLAGHRIAWALFHGAWPATHIDHRDRNPANNRISNLRAAVPAQNMQNRGLQSFNTTGFKGVSFYNARKYFVARIVVDGKQHELGGYGCAQDAAMAYDRAATYFFGDRALTNWALGRFDLAAQAVAKGGDRG